MAGVHRRSLVRSGTALVTLVAVVLIVSACAAEPPVLRPDGSGPERYVALGDSSVSGPLIGPPVGPLGCFRSANNYPHLVGAALETRQFVDVSCGNAVLDDLSEPQDTGQFGISFGQVPPQFDALTRDTDLVTIAMGGNDVGLPDVITGCINVLQVPLGPPPFGQSCIPKYVVDGVDTFSQKIEATRPRYLGALAEIRRRAPHARVFVINYMAAFPAGDRGCYPAVPALDVDVVYGRAKLEEMNRMMAGVAAEAGVGFIDIYGPSVGHDVCQDAATRWMNGLAWDTAGIIGHANVLGHAAFARIVTDAVADRTNS